MIISALNRPSPRGTSPCEYRHTRSRWHSSSTLLQKGNAAENTKTRRAANRQSRPTHSRCRRPAASLMGKFRRSGVFVCLERFMVRQICMSAKVRLAGEGQGARSIVCPEPSYLTQPSSRTLLSGHVLSLVCPRCAVYRVGGGSQPEGLAWPGCQRRLFRGFAIPVIVHGLKSSRHTPCAAGLGFLRSASLQPRAVVAIDGTPADGTRSVPATFRRPPRERLPIP